MMAQVIIDRGYYKLGYENISTGEKHKPEWVSDKNAYGIAIGIEGQPFQMFHIKDLRAIISHVNKLLQEDENEDI